MVCSNLLIFNRLWPDDVGQITWAESQSRRIDVRALYVFVVEGILWLGGRDSNPDTVVQSAVNGCGSVPVLFEFSAVSFQ